MTEADVRLKLAEMEAERVANGSTLLHDTTNASAFVVNGLDLQDQQYVGFTFVLYSYQSLT